MMVASLPVLFTNPAGQLSADPAGFLRLDWLATPRTLADTQGLLNHASLALQQHGWSKVLGNQTQMLPFSPAEQQWVSQEWLPQAVQVGGYRYGAILVSPDTYARLATAYITTNGQGLPIRYRSFDQEAEAIAWLAQQLG
jgi:hypothetical protein